MSEQFSLRCYQQRIIANIHKAFLKDQRTLAVAATGTGKTVIFSHVIDDYLKKGRVMVLAHRDELIQQACAKLRNMGSVLPTVEKADQWSDEENIYGNPPLVVSSIQTQSTGRMNRFKPRDFSLVVVDEAHHSTATSWEKVINYYAENPDCKILGVTATPDRADGEMLGQIFQSVADTYSLTDAVEDGYLVPVRPWAVEIEGLDFSKIRTLAGDFNQGELEAAMMFEEPLHGVAHAMIEISCGLEPGALKPLLDDPERKTKLATILSGRIPKKCLIFCVSVAHAERMAEIIERWIGESAVVVSGKLADEDRAKYLKQFAKGEKRFLCNCMIATEGFDCLDVATEILTPDGWRGIGQLETGGLMYSLNTQTEKMELVTIDGYAERKVRPSEKMFSINSQHINIRTTEGHSFYIKHPRKSPANRGFVVEKGTELFSSTGEYSIPLSAQDDSFPGLGVTDDELRLVAWFMTDGGFENGAFCISQAKEYHNEIRELLTRLNLDFTERVRKNRQGFGCKTAKPLHVFKIPKGTHHGKYERDGWNKYAPLLDKNVSKLLHTMTRRQFGIFWKELLKGDGSVSGKKSGWLWCCEKSQADAYTHMAVVRGYAASYTAETTQYGTIVYRVTCRDKQWITSDPHDQRSARMTLTDANPNERVWCVSNKNHTLVCRRNGKVAIIGNCPSIDMIIMARPTKSRSLYAQMLGRGTRPAENIAHRLGEMATPEERCTLIAESEKPFMSVLDFVGNSGRHELVTAVDIFGDGYEEEEVDRAKELAAEGDMDAMEALEESREELEQKRREAEQRRKEMEEKRRRQALESARQGLVGTTNYKVNLVNEWDDPPETISPKHVNIFRKAKVPLKDVERMTTQQHGELARKIVMHWQMGLCSYRQAKVLTRNAWPRESLERMTFEVASSCIDAIARSGWRLKYPQWKAQHES